MSYQILRFFELHPPFLFLVTATMLVGGRDCSFRTTQFSHWHAHLRGFVGETFELFQRERFRLPCQLLCVLDTLRIS
jgi:hypothetical protein